MGASKISETIQTVPTRHGTPPAAPVAVFSITSVVTRTQVLLVCGYSCWSTPAVMGCCYPAGG